MRKVVVSVVLLLFLVAIVATTSFAQTQCVITDTTLGFVDKEPIVEFCLFHKTGLNDNSTFAVEDSENKLRKPNQ